MAVTEPGLDAAEGVPASAFVDDRTDQVVGSADDDAATPPIGLLVTPTTPAFVPRARITLDSLADPARYARAIFWYRLIAQMLALLSVSLLGFFHQYRLAIAVVVPLCLAIWVYGYVAGAREAAFGDLHERFKEDAALVEEEREHQRFTESIPCDVWPNHLPAYPDAGYVYAIRFGTGTIKVGKTNHPGRRLAEHRRGRIWRGAHVVLDFPGAYELRRQ